ncbi:hypothetical protein BH20ACI1_BH20ACI1_26870 [soil metagenome]
MKDLFEISFDEKGITRKENFYRIFWLWNKITSGKGYREEKIEWQNIKEIYVYKRDAYIVDIIAMAFRMEDEKVFETNEQMAGWQLLIDNLPKIFPESKPFHEWFMEVAFPAFEFNLIKIYPREN